MIDYTEHLDGLTADRLHGFFGHWARQPAPEDHLRLLKGSDHVVLAIDSESGMVVGNITAITDGVSCAYIPHLEVLPSYQGQGIGSELVRRLLARLSYLYMVDLVCDPELQPFYQRLGMRPASAMIVRRYEHQPLNSGTEARRSLARPTVRP